MFSKARTTWVDFGDDIRVNQTSVQVTVNHTTGSIVCQQVVGIVNLDSRNI